jgi:hypothetical protein
VFPTSKEKLIPLLEIVSDQYSSAKFKLYNTEASKEEVEYERLCDIKNIRYLLLAAVDGVKEPLYSAAERRLASAVLFSEINPDELFCDRWRKGGWFRYFLTEAGFRTFFSFFRKTNGKSNGGIVLFRLRSLVFIILCGLILIIEAQGDLSWLRAQTDRLFPDPTSDLKNINLGLFSFHSVHLGWV